LGLCVWNRNGKNIKSQRILTYCRVTLRAAAILVQFYGSLKLKGSYYPVKLIGCYDYVPKMTRCNATCKPRHLQPVQ
jgi:hypothetical protein